MRTQIIDSTLIMLLHYLQKCDFQFIETIKRSNSTHFVVISMKLHRSKKKKHRFFFSSTQSKLAKEETTHNSREVLIETLGMNIPEM